MSDRAIRNLANLKRSASTARVLNLLKVAEDHRNDDDWREQPLFRSPILNQSIIIKHRLRRNEGDIFPGRRQIATKVVIPIDTEDLKSGGRYFFVGQNGFLRAVKEAFGLAPEHPDIHTLRLLDDLPSLDPFLLRERLRDAGLTPAPCYFGLSDADMARMSAFVEKEIEPLVTLSLGKEAGGASGSHSTRRMASKILSNNPGDRMDILGQTLRLRPEQYEEGVFCWKGFIYYIWVLTSLMQEIQQVAEAVWSVRPVGPTDVAAREYLDRGRKVLRELINRTCDEVVRTLKVYEEAYAGLIVEGNPGGFRDFLLDAPGLFVRLGEQLGAVQHVVSFWRFRFRDGAAQLTVEELIDIFMDFETGLGGRGEDLEDDMMLVA
jgi:hypothetical protein